MSRNFTIGLPCSPSTRTNQEIKQVKEIMVTFGGGMGGSSTTYYGDIISDEDGFINIKDFQNETIKLNKLHIVHIKDKQLVFTETDTTEHTNYREKQCDSSSINQVFAISVFDTVNFSNEYFSNDDKDLKSISKIFVQN